MGTIGIVVALAMIVFAIAWIKREIYIKKIYQHPCPACGSDFSDALFDYMGAVSRADIHKLDSFQQRHARCTVRCCGCGARVICADNGDPMKAYYVEVEG